MRHSSVGCLIARSHFTALLLPDVLRCLATTMMDAPEFRKRTYCETIGKLSSVVTKVYRTQQYSQINVGGTFAK